MSLNAVRATSVTRFLHLANAGAVSSADVTEHLASTGLEPARMASGLARMTNRTGQDVIVCGPVDQRVVFMRRLGSRWSALSLSDTPLGGTPWPEPVRDGCEFTEPHLDVSAVRMTAAAEHRLTRPYVLLVSLYHEENFPLPRFALGISDLARAIRTAMTGQVGLSDMQLGHNIEQIVAQIEATDPDILGVSATFGQHDLLIQFLDRLAPRFHSGHTLLVLGGSLSALNAKVLLDRYPKAIVARGPGEPTMIDVVEYWHGDRDLPQVRNIRYVGSEQILITKRITNREYDDILPELDLLEGTLARQGVLQLESSRGCTHACSFCPREHKGIWTGYQAAEMKTLLRTVSPVYVRHPDLAKKVFLVDEEFIGRDRHGLVEQRAMDVARTLHESGFRWETSSRVDQVFRPAEDPAWHHRRIAVWRDLRANGLDRCLFGVESGVESILKRFNKHSTPDQNVRAVRILTAIGLPIRCTYITFDQLMTMDELVESYRFQGRPDMTFQPMKEATPEEIFAAINDESTLAGHLASRPSRPFYEHISYMLVSMECLLGSPYLRQVEKEGLALKILPSMGRRNAVFLDRRIGALSNWSQRWVDHNFAFDYTLKSIEKITLGEEHEAARRVRRVLKASAYHLFGRMLWLCHGDDSLQAASDARWPEFTGDFRGARISDHDMAANDDLLSRLSDYHLAALRHELATELEAISGALAGARATLLSRAWSQWERKADWLLINPPEMCIAE